MDGAGTTRVDERRASRTKGLFKIAHIVRQPTIDDKTGKVRPHAPVCLMEETLFSHVSREINRAFDGATLPPIDTGEAS